MASPAAGRDVPDTPPRDERGPLEPSHPEPACQEAQKWIEAVTGKSFGDKDFRSALENGILLCELLSAIRPGLVKKINRLPTPIAGLDNLSVFLRGCEELGLKGSQLFDPGDLQDTSIRANLKDSDCNRKLKNVLNTVFWLGKAASGCASYSGPTLNLKEFEGLLAQMKMEGGDSPQKRSVRDSGYDCWDSERSESLSPPQHTRDNSLDSLDSFGSRSQHSPSPDVVNRGNSDGRGSDSEADAQSRKPDVRKDDMLARRTASSESRSSIPFNQFLPNRTNASCYIPTPRRKPHTEEGDEYVRSNYSIHPSILVFFLFRSVSMGDMLNEEEVGHLPPLSQSRYERMHEQYNNFQEDEEHWQDELARWKNRRRSASQELIKKEEERKRIEKRMKAEGGDGNKRKSVKTYKEIVEEKERREAELREAYRNAATPEEAAMVLQRYALRFIISDATLDSLKLPRSISNTKPGLNQVDKEHKPSSPLNDFESSEPIEKPEPMVIAFQRQTKPEEKETSVSDSTSSPAPNNPTSTVTNSEHIPPQSLERNEPQSKPTESPTTHQIQLITGDAQPQPKHSSPQIAQVQPHSTQPLHALPSPPSLSSRPLPLTPAPSCPQQLPQETEDITSKQTERDVPPEEKKNEETTEQPTPPQTEKRNTSSGSAISSLIEGRNCIITTTIVTELTHVEPHHPDIQSNGQTPMLNLAKRVNHWVWDPNEERKRLERWQQEQERLLQEQYQREQERLKKEWEIAQLEVEEEERKHNEEVETVNKCSFYTALSLFRCVSGKRLCSGCSQPLGKGAAMIIDTLGLFFHIQCFKCGMCNGQLGDATAGTDVRIRNGLLSCHECYIASRGRGQPTTL
uniref:LIM and calponin homology domains-containing protein 1-like n=1 Tax=Mastacembelus armatus TaxID=205130 RepID=A0A7N8YGK7_9TELE